MADPAQTRAERRNARRRANSGLINAIIVWGPGLLLVVAGFAVTWSFIEPAPPTRVTLATGSPTGSYAKFGSGYASIFAEDGLELEVQHTGGTVDNLKRLATGESMAAIVQGGVPLPATAPPVELQAIAALYYEPVMVFHRGAAPFETLGALAGRRVAVGGPDSGTRSVAEALLQSAGLADGVERSPVAGDAVVAALEKGEIDAAFVVISPDHPRVARLLSTPGVHLMRFERAVAYARRLPFLTPVTLNRGVVDLDRDLPPVDVPLLAATAALVARADMHDALPPLFVEAVRAVHGQGSPMAAPDAFPALEPVDFPVETETRLAFENGRSFLYRVLPFWAASMADRLKILILPLLTLLIPLIRVAPPVYRWRIRSRIYRWYRDLRALEGQLDIRGKARPTSEHWQTLHRLKGEIAAVEVPLSYMEEFYHLRLHVDLIERRMAAAAGMTLPPPGGPRPPGAPPPAAPPPPPPEPPTAAPGDDAAASPRTMGDESPADVAAAEPNVYRAPEPGGPSRPAEHALSGEIPMTNPRVLPDTAGADAIVRRWTLWSAGFGLIPIPLVDFATTTGFSLKMLHSLAGYYDTPFKADVGKAAITSLLGGAAAPTGALGLVSLVKGIPLIGTPLAIAAGPIMSGSITYAIGRVFTAHFGSGGTLFDFDPEAFRDYFQQQVEAGKAFVKREQATEKAEKGKDVDAGKAQAAS